MTHQLVLADDPLLRSSIELARARGFVAAVPAGDVALERDRLILADLLTKHPDVADRTCRPGHLTGSAFVVDATADHALLLFHTKLQRWLQPGGHADGETNLAAVALREATEESGIVGLRIDPAPVDLDIHLVDPPKEDAHLHLDVRFVVVAPPGARPTGNHESESIRWVPRDELDGYGVDAGLLRMANAAFDRVRSTDELLHVSGEPA